jgi:hypothetical protein
MKRKLVSAFCFILLQFLAIAPATAQSSVAVSGRIRITAEAPISGYKTFMQGDRFNVLISSPNAPATESDLGIDDVQVLHQGQDLLVSFRLRQGTTAAVRQKLNVIEISIQTTQANNAGAPGPTTAENSSEFITTSTASLGSKSNTDGNSEVVTSPSENRVRESSPPSNTGSTNNGNGARVLGASAAPAPAIPLPLNEDILKDNKLNVVSDEDLAVPESPAFTVLGLTPQTVTRPATPKEFASSLLNGVDEHGNFQSGLALDAVPFLVFAGDSVSLYRYNRNYMLRLLSRTQTSFATTKGTGDDDKSIRLALGLHMTVWDKGDPRADDLLFACYDRVDQDIQKDIQTFLVTTPGGVKSPLFNDFLAARKAVFTTKTDECDVEARKRNWKKTGFVIGAAPSWISTTGTTDKFRWNGGGVWASLAYGFEGISGLQDNSQLIFHVRFRSNEQVPDPAAPGTFFTQNSSYFGTRLRLGNADTNVSFEGVYIRLKRPGELRDNSYRYSLGFERRIAQNIWFQLALGSDAGRRDSNNQAFVRGTFNWGFTRKQDANSPAIASQ